MRRIAGALILLGDLLPAATIVASSRAGNLISLQLSDGAAEVEWLSDSSFRFTRRWDGAFPRRPATNPDSIHLTIGDTPDSLKVSSKHLLLTISKRGAMVRVAEPDGTTIMADASEVESRNGALSWERTTPPLARFHGLGARPDAVIELRGSVTRALTPFLMSNFGYGEFHVAPGDYSFDVARETTDRYRIEARGANKVDYYFFFGPSPKEILELYQHVKGPMEGLSPSKFRLVRPSEVPAQATVLEKGSLAEIVQRWINGSLSGVLLPAFSLDPYRDAPDALRQRAIQLGSVAPIVLGSRPDWIKGTVRDELAAYFATYAEEARERGLPLIRALAMQFPKDAEAAKAGDAFMLGDELLAAPLFEAGNARSLYLPMGIWTRLGNNQVYRGKQVISFEAAEGELPLFSRNGAILPLGSDPMKLHYFPRLGAEFFLFESDLGEYSQVHAGPAGDFMRFEIESKKDREYEWVAHHFERPRKVVAGAVEYVEVDQFDRLRSGAWLYDAASKNLHVRTQGRAGADEIVSISF